MRAVDTNVIVRYLTEDDAEQSRRARRCIEAGDLLVTTTVLLETEWVLRRRHRFTTRQITAALRALAGQPGICAEAPRHLALACDWAEVGMDFAAALHLATAPDCGAFVSFDEALARDAARMGSLPVVAP